MRSRVGAGVGGETRLANTLNGASFVVVRQIAADAYRTDDLIGVIANQHSAGTGSMRPLEVLARAA